MWHQIQSERHHSSQMCIADRPRCVVKVQFQWKRILKIFILRVVSQSFSQSGIGFNNIADNLFRKYCRHRLLLNSIISHAKLFVIRCIHRKSAEPINYSGHANHVNGTIKWSPFYRQPFIYFIWINNQSIGICTMLSDETPKICTCALRSNNNLVIDFQMISFTYSHQCKKCSKI